MFSAQVLHKTATQLVISKSDLASTGLTATANNTAESLVVALIKQWQSVLNTTAQQAKLCYSSDS